MITVLFSSIVLLGTALFSAPIISIRRRVLRTRKMSECMSEYYRRSAQRSERVYHVG